MNKRVIDGIRAYYALPNDVSDEQIKEHMKGSLGEALVTMNIATSDLKLCLAKQGQGFLKRILDHNN